MEKTPRSLVQNDTAGKVPIQIDTVNMEIINNIYLIVIKNFTDDAGSKLATQIVTVNSIYQISIMKFVN